MSTCFLDCRSYLLRIGPVASIVSVGWDALAGYTFARVAQNYGRFGLSILLNFILLISLT